MSSSPYGLTAWKNDSSRESCSPSTSPEHEFRKAGMFDKLREECAVMGVFGHPEAANMVYLGLYALQHRGQESSGIVSSDGKVLVSHRQMGLVADIFKEEVIKRLEGASAIGHNRYSTSGQSHIKNAQPFVVEYVQGPIAISHNGNNKRLRVFYMALSRSGIAVV